MTSDSNLDDMIEKAEAEHFVGREREIEIFRYHIMLTPPNYLFFYITGEGGVGKTTLLNRYKAIARRELGILVASSDERQRDIPTLLGYFSKQLSDSKIPLRRFNERYKVYQQKVHEIQNDPAAPQGLAALIGRMAIQGAFAVSEPVPGIGRLVEKLPQDSLANQAGEWTGYLAKKLSRKDEIALIRDPVTILTPLFFEDLKEIAQRQKVLLSFENFEAAQLELQHWFARLLDYKVSQNIRFVIAGRNEPDKVNWERLRHVTLMIRLDVFTESESERFLDIYGVTNPKRRSEILVSSDRLPVIMGWLAAPEGNEPDLSQPTQNIVERFLRWVDDPALRDIALAGAIPRTFNAEILKTLLDSQHQNVNGQQAFDWLLTMPFVKKRSDGWYYHDYVRSRMMDYQRERNPQSYRKKHAVLAAFFNANRREVDLSELEIWASEQWRKDTIPYCYHSLLANPMKYWAEVMTIFALAVRMRRTFAIELIDMLSQEDVRTEISQEQTRIIQLFRQQLQAIREGTTLDGFAMFDTLCQIIDLGSEARGHMLAYRAECLRLDGKLEEALNDFNNALSYLPDDVRTLSRRGTTYILLRRFDEAFLDLNQALTLNPNDAWANAVRGEAYRRIGRYKDALTDLDRAISLDESHAWAIAMRGETYRLLGKYEEALIDFNRAINLDEKYSWAISRREEVEQQIKLEREMKDVNKSSFNLASQIAPNEGGTPTAESFSGISVGLSTPQPSNPSLTPVLPPSPYPPTIPTWQNYGQQGIPYVASSPSSRGISAPANDVYPTPVSMYTQSKDIRTPLFIPDTPRLSTSSFFQRHLRLLISVIIIILLLLVTLFFIFHGNPTHSS